MSDEQVTWPGNPPTWPEPVGWNVYATASDGEVVYPPKFLEFIPNENALAPAASAFADEVEAFAAAEVTCGAELFPLLPGLPYAGTLQALQVALTGVKPPPQQGPAPLACAREPHPDSPWHWAHGTWWR